LKQAVDMAVKAVVSANAAMSADAAASVKIESAANMPLLEYAENFWKSDSEYIREKALVEKKPVSMHYLLTNRRMVEIKMKPFPGFSGLTLGGLSKPVIRLWKIWLAEQGYSGRTINCAMLALRVPVKRAFQDDIIPSDPFAGVPRAAHSEKTRGVLTLTEIKKLSETPAQDYRQRLAVFLPLFCSLRMGEVRGLQWGDISDGVIHIQHNWQEGEGVKPCKCGSNGYVPMPHVIASLINEIRVIAPLTGPENFVMAVKPGHPICREFLTQSLRNELALIGIDEEERKKRNIVYHSLRHSFCTMSRLIGLSDFEVMAISRHKDIKMLERYSHREALDVRNLTGKFEQFLCSR
jgi:integrase